MTAKVTPEKIEIAVFSMWQNYRAGMTRRMIARALGVRVTPWLLTKLDETVDRGTICWEIQNLTNGLPVYVYFPTDAQ